MPHDPLDPAPPAAVPAATASAAPPAQRDAHGFDPDDYDWLPVPRQRQRSDGWTPALQRRFIEALADSGLVAEAARAVGMSTQACYALRRAADAAGFARAWDAAIDQAGKALLDLAFDRVINGQDIPILDRDGQRIGGRRLYSDKLTIFLLRGFFPERFGALGERGGGGGGGGRTLTQPPAIPPVEAALAALAPVTPADPHKLMPPEALADLIAGEAADAAEEERFRRDYPDAAAREDAGIPREPFDSPPAVAESTGDWFWDTVARVEAADAEAARAARRAKRKKRATP
ncbi:MAG: hypothetical protein V4659_07970 [Pseudomonadota bacterium]